MDIVKITDHDDGSATITVDMTHEEVVAFAKIGMLKSLVDAAKATIDTETKYQVEEDENDYKGDPINDRDDIECRSRNPAKICANCTCWKNQNE